MLKHFWYRPLRLLLFSLLLGLGLLLSACKEDGDLPGQTQGVVEATPTPPLPSGPTGDALSLKGEDGAYQCDVIIAGGSTAALAAALTSAREKRITCWLEPTDWPGGQLTVIGNSALDLASYKLEGLDLETLVQHPPNQAREFLAWMASLKGNPGHCWVSKKCYEPQNLLKSQIFPAIQHEIKQGYLYPFYNTVVKNVQSKGKYLESLNAIQRKPLQGTGHTQAFSQAVADWYSPKDSDFFSKQTLRFRAPQGKRPVFIDASELGDLLVLSGSPFLQGQEMQEGRSQNETSVCGQAFSFPLVAEYSERPVVTASPVPISPRSEKFYSDLAWERKFSWGEIWSYRRIRTPESMDPKTQWPKLISAHPGELSLQNWNPGNDYPFGSPFKDLKATEAERANWQGGLNLLQLEAAEKHALGWFDWLKNQAPETIKPYISLNRSVLGTASGLARFPYLRDTRRSIGIGNFVLRLEDIAKRPKQKTAKVFEDRLGIGAYQIDIHPLYCRYSIKTLQTHQIYPYYLPYRALTNQRYANLLVGGKTMAQSFLVSASTRVHGIEWHSGIAVGASAAYLSQYQLDSAELLSKIQEVQAKVKKYAPLDWSWPKVSSESNANKP